MADMKANRIRDKSLFSPATKGDVIQASKAVMEKVKSLVKEDIGQSEMGMAIKFSKIMEAHLEKALVDHFHSLEKRMEDKVEALRQGYEAGIKSLELLLKNLPTTILPKEAIQVSVAMPSKSVKSIIYDSTSGRPTRIEEELK